MISQDESSLIRLPTGSLSIAMIGIIIIIIITIP